MYINGIGIVSACGTGLEAFGSALAEPGFRPRFTEEKGGRKVFISDLSGSAARASLKTMRRADKLSKMAVSAALEALGVSDHTQADGSGVGVVLSTALGPHPTNFLFLDDIIEYGDDGVSPTVFSNSVHNAAASYIAELCGIDGPTLTVTQFFHSFHQALLLGTLWLREGRCRKVLAGAVEVYGPVLGYAADVKLPPAGDGIIRPFVFGPPAQSQGEGAVFCLLERDRSERTLCKVDDVVFHAPDEAPAGCDINIIDSDGLVEDESPYLGLLSAGTPVAAFSPHFGSMMSGSAFNLAAGALMLSEGRCFSNPVTDNPHGLRLLDEGDAAGMGRISISRLDCSGLMGSIILSAPAD
jgi:3-oxoacyl-[acyl-carrier-protein] synthase II